MENGSIAALILTLALDGVRRHPQDLAALHQGKEPALPVEYKAGWTLQAISTFRRRCVLPQLGFKSWIIQPVA